MLMYKKSVKLILTFPQKISLLHRCTMQYYVQRKELPLDLVNILEE